MKWRFSLQYLIGLSSLLLISLFDVGQLASISPTFKNLWQTLICLKVSLAGFNQVKTIRFLQDSETVLFLCQYVSLGLPTDFWAHWISNTLFTSVHLVLVYSEIISSVSQVGHAGTLDPLSTGLLIVCVGKATKLADRSVFATLKKFWGSRHCFWYHKYFSSTYQNSFPQWS